MDPVNALAALKNSKEWNSDQIQQYASQDEDIRILAQQILPMAILNKGVSLEEFDFKGYKLTVLNYTKHKIHFYGTELSVDNHYISTFTKSDCKVIAYQVNGSLDYLCFEDKDVGKEKTGRFYVKLIYGPERANNHDFTTNLIKMNSGKLALTERRFLSNAVHELTKGFFDVQSILSKVPKEIIGNIFSIIHLYKDFLESKFPMRQFLSYPRG